jgi:cell division initiation protein
MKITPMDIQRQGFGLRFRGFDRDEVRAFLELVAEEMAAVQQERDRVTQQNQHLELVLQEHREREAILKNTLLTAQRVSEDIRENARKSAEGVVREAELQADKLLELAQTRAHEVERTIVDLRSHRSVLRQDIRSLVTRVTSFLDVQEQSELEDNLRFLKRREEAQS